HTTDQFPFILEEIFGFSVKKDKMFWPAEYEAGRLYLEKFNKAASSRAFERALVLNPRSADVLAAKAASAMQRFENKEAEDLVEVALKINPSLTEALRIRADLKLFSGEYDAALKDLEKARGINPREEETLALIAAVHYVKRDTKALDAIVAEVEKHN